MRQQHPDNVEQSDSSSGSQRDQPEENPSTGLEALLMDEHERENPVESLIEREVRPVEPEPRRSWTVLLLLSLLTVAVVSAFMLWQQNPAKKNGVTVAAPATQQLEVRQPMPARPEVIVEEQVIEVQPHNAFSHPDLAPAVVSKGKQLKSVAPANPKPTGVETAAENVSPQPEQLFRVLVGPFINSTGLEQGRLALEDLGLKAKQYRERGPVPMVRLLEGVYPPDQARSRLKTIKETVESAFLLPKAGQYALYAGSFFELERALKLQQDLAEQDIQVQVIDTEIEMEGTVFEPVQADQKTAEQMAEHLRQKGLHVRIMEVR